MNKLLLILWFVSGVIVIASGSPSTFLYFLCWINLIIVLLEKVCKERK